MKSNEIETKKEIKKEGVLVIRDVSFFMVFMEGVLTFISPCILPMLPIYFAYLAGNAAKESKASPKLFINSIAFVLGFIMIFTVLGASATLIGGLLNRNRQLFQYISGLVIILFGLRFLGVIRLGFLNKEKRLAVNIQNLGFFGSILFGIVFSFGWTACTGPFLAAALLVASNMDTMIEGMFLLLMYGVGLGIPFLLSALLFDKMEEVFAFIQRHRGKINIAAGVLLIMMGILVLTGVMQYIGTL